MFHLYRPLCKKIMPLLMALLPLFNIRFFGGNVYVRAFSAKTFTVGNLLKGLN